MVARVVAHRSGHGLNRRLAARIREQVLEARRASVAEEGRVRGAPEEEHSRCEARRADGPLLAAVAQGEHEGAHRVGGARQREEERPKDDRHGRTLAATVENGRGPARGAGHARTTALHLGP